MPIKESKKKEFPNDLTNDQEKSNNEGFSKNSDAAPNSRIRDLEFLILKLDLMERQCIQEKLNEEKWALQDDYIATKRDIYKLLSETSELIRSRYELQFETGNSVEVIQKGNLIRKQLNTLENQYYLLKEIVMKQSKQRGKKYTVQQIDQRFEELQLMKQHIDGIKKLFENPNPYIKKEIQTFFEFKTAKKNSELIKLARNNSEWRDLNEDEEAVLYRWRERDRDIDKQVEEVGDRIDRLGEIAIEIGQKTEEQARLVANLNAHAEHANQQLVDVNNKLNAFLMKGGGFNFLCKIVLLVLIIGVNGFTFTILSKRILR